MNVQCVHEWVYSNRSIRQDDYRISETPARECKKCHREEAKWGPKYSQSYAPVYQPWEPDGTAVKI